MSTNLKRKKSLQITATSDSSSSSGSGISDNSSVTATQIQLLRSKEEPFENKNKNKNEIDFPKVPDLIDSKSHDEITMYCPNCGSYDKFTLESLKMLEIHYCHSCNVSSLLAFWGYSCGSSILSASSSYLYDKKRRSLWYPSISGGGQGGEPLNVAILLGGAG